MSVYFFNIPVILKYGIEACMAAGVTGTPRAPRGIRGDGYGAYGGSVVLGS